MDSAFYACKNLTSVTIGNSVASIGDHAFAGANLASVTIPNSVTSIGIGAFFSCDSLASITIPKNVRSIGNSAFSHCPSLTEIKVTADNNAYTAENGILYNKNKTSLIGYPAGKTDVSFTIPNSVKSIVYSAFYGCKYLASVTIPNSVKSIEFMAFSYCANLTSVTFQGTIASGSFGDQYPDDLCDKFYAANKTNGTPGTYTKPDGNSKTWTIAAATTPAVISQYDSESDFQVTKAGNVITITKYIGNKTVVNIPPSIQNTPVTTIGISAFQNCRSLTSVTIPNSVTSIGGAAFYNCTSLTSITIPNSVTSIGGAAFYGCASLTSVTFVGTIPSSGFGTNNTFPSGLRAEFYATDAVNGTPGTYTKSGPTAGNVKGSTWAKQ